MRSASSTAKGGEAPLPVEAERGDFIHGLCLGRMQVRDVRPDGHEVMMRREPPAADWPIIWARLNRQWRERRGWRRRSGP